MDILLTILSLLACYVLPIGCLWGIAVLIGAQCEIHEQRSEAQRKRFAERDRRNSRYEGIP